jgi:hypothetical protein
MSNNFACSLSFKAFTSPISSSTTTKETHHSVVPGESDSPCTPAYRDAMYVVATMSGRCDHHSLQYGVQARRAAGR